LVPHYYLSKYIASLISPLAGNTASFVKDSAHFVSIIEDLKLRRRRFDVKSLFTNVLITEVVEVIRDMLKKDETLEDRTILTPDMCLRSTYFSYNDIFYEQREGAQGFPQEKKVERQS
jgi:hypothetical protein